MEDLISIPGIEQKKYEIFSTAKNLNEGFKTFMSWLFANRERMDEVGQQYVDAIVDNFYRVAEEAIAKMPDSLEKRQARRHHGIGEGKHITSSVLLKQLNGELEDRQDIEKSWEILAARGVQAALEVLFDIQVAGGLNKIEVTCFGLFFWMIDEALSAIHLASHRYIIQANSHFRGILEALDRVELFFKVPEWIDVWAGEDKARIRRELSPGEVRRLLGREKKWDSLYSYYSEVGTHPTFESFQARTLRKVDDPEERATVFVGGTPLVHLHMFGFGLGLNVIQRMFSSIVNHFVRFQNEDDVTQAMQRLVADGKEFTMQHFVPWAEANKIDIDGIAILIQNFDLEGGNVDE